MKIEITRTCLLSEKFVGNIMNRLFETFAKEELRNVDSQLKAFNSPEYYISYCLNRENNVIGFMLWWNFKVVRFIEYLYVDKNFRLQGYGSSILRSCLNTKKQVVVEVRKNERVEKFYYNNDFVKNNFLYSPIALNEYGGTVEYSIFSYITKLNSNEYNMFLETIHKVEYQF